jgi:hypothetical protein
MSTHKAIVVFTAKSIERILREGGTSSWRLDRNNARQCEFAICTRNANADWAEGPEEHHAAFMVGKVKNVVPSPDRKGNYFLIQFSEYALVNVPEVWKGDRNPVKYGTLEDFGIDPSTLEWQAMPKATSTTVAIPPTYTGPTPLSISEAKNGLALALGVAPEAIEITIRG